MVDNSARKPRGAIRAANESLRHRQHRPENEDQMSTHGSPRPTASHSQAALPGT